MSCTTLGTYEHVWTLMRWDCCLLDELENSNQVWQIVLLIQWVLMAFWNASINITVWDPLTRSKKKSKNDLSWKKVIRSPLSMGQGPMVFLRPRVHGSLSMTARFTREIRGQQDRVQLHADLDALGAWSDAGSPIIDLQGLACGAVYIKSANLCSPLSALTYIRNTICDMRARVKNE